MLPAIPQRYRRQTETSLSVNDRKKTPFHCLQGQIPLQRRTYSLHTMRKLQAHTSCLNAPHIPERLGRLRNH